MNKKDLVYWVIIVILIIILVLTIIEVKHYPKMKERTESYEGDCEIWKVCDNVPDLWAPMLPTPDDYTYKCWEEKRDCKKYLSKSINIKV